MPSFGRRSLKEKETLHKDLQFILELTIKYVDFSIIQGTRDKEEQDRYYNQGKSKVKYPNSNHNTSPSLAVDIAPWVPGIGIDWKNLERFQKIVFFIKGIAYANGIEIRLGADWDGDFYSKDHTFLDIPHLELKRKLIDGEWLPYDRQE
jgi:peptidoglycan L-alanyl-D-glutamate endopeptidase CwlK